MEILEAANNQWQERNNNLQSKLSHYQTSNMESEKLKVDLTQALLKNKVRNINSVVPYF